jgi:hypothetical protein
VWRRGFWGQVIALRVLLAAMLIAWSILAYNVGQRVLVHALGQEIEGRVTHLRKDDRHKGTDYYVTYAFDVDQTHRSAEEEVSQKRWQTLAVGSPVPVKSIRLGGERVDELSFSALESISHGWYVGFAFLSLMSFVLFYCLWVLPIRTKRLIRTGETAQGFVIKVTLSQKSDEQTVHYTFTPAGGESRTASTDGPKLPAAHVGQNVTVFYDPHKPRHSVAYEFCEFETDVQSV